MKSKIKILNISLVVALVFSVLLSMVDFDARCEDLRDNVFRLHIIANSDSLEDQSLKLKVRDALLRESEGVFSGADTLEDAIILASTNVDIIESVAKKTLKENGCDYPVRVSVEKSFFDTRVYDDFSLPAGVYDALRIEIGEAVGKNWWCVIFPNICVGAAGELSDTASIGAVNIATNSENFVIKFKIVELYETVKNKFINWF